MEKDKTRNRKVDGGTERQTDGQVSSCVCVCMFIDKDQNLTILREEIEIQQCTETAKKSEYIEMEIRPAVTSTSSAFDP